MRWVDFSNSRMVGVNFRRVNAWEGCFMRLIRNIDARDGNFERADFWRARLDGADFRDANLEGIAWTIRETEGTRVSKSFVDALLKCIERLQVD